MKTSYLTIVALALVASASAGKIEDTLNALPAKVEGKLNASPVKVEDALNALPENVRDMIPTIPGDNSHYVEGKSRYIWFPDGDNEPYLVDLKEAISESTLADVTKDAEDIHYWLYTRDNPYEIQVLVNGDKDSVLQSKYSADKPTKVIVHGWRSDGRARVNTAITAALMLHEDCNVIVVDWSKLASNINYVAVSKMVPEVGENVGEFLTWLFDNVGGSWETLQLVGHSLGAHVVGNAGRFADGRPQRISGLDPAGPKWRDNDKALNKDDGQYVEIIHTDGGVLGIYRPIGDVDFYPNGGANRQPGCWFSICSHQRAYKLFAATINHDHLVGRACTSYDEAKENKCTGDEFPMGNAVTDKTGSGLYGLTTEAHWPY